MFIFSFYFFQPDRWARVYCIILNGVLIHHINIYQYKWQLIIRVVPHNKHECTGGALIGPRVRYVFFFKIIFVGIFY